MRKRLLTIDDLVKFCKTNKVASFSAKEYGQQLCVQIPAKFEIEEDDETSSTLFCNIVAFHTGRNRNGSNVTEEAAKNCLTTIPYKPILADIQEINGTDGEFDFTTHAMEINNDGSINYIERQVGCFTVDDIYLDEKADSKGRKYVHAKAAIPREYTKAAEIIESKEGTKVSVELGINSLEYDAKAKELILSDIEVLGCTLLGRDPETGREIGEGMEGARLDISDFSIENNSVSEQSKIVEVIQELKIALDNYTATFAENTNLERKEDEVKLNKELFEELLAQYNVTEADITFEYSELDDDALREAFITAFEKDEDSSSEGEVSVDDAKTFDGESGEESGEEGSEEPADPTDPAEPETPETPTEPTTPETPETPETPSTPVVIDGDDDDDDDEKKVNRDDGTDAEYLKKISNSSEEPENVEEEKVEEFTEKVSDVKELADENSENVKEITYSATFNGETKTFAQSLSEIICSITELVNATYGESDNAWYDCDVMDDKTVVMHDFWNNKHYKQKYTVKDGTYTLKNERVEVFARYLTQEELDALEGLKAKFEEVSTELSKYEAEPEKMSVLESSEYDNLNGTESFEALKEQSAHFDMSVDELKTKLDSMLLDYAKHNKVEFAEKESTKKIASFKRIPSIKTSGKSSRYGKMFSKN